MPQTLLIANKNATSKKNSFLEKVFIFILAVLLSIPIMYLIGYVLTFILLGSVIWEEILSFGFLSSKAGIIAFLVTALIFRPLYHNTLKFIAKDDIRSKIFIFVLILVAAGFAYLGKDRHFSKSADPKSICVDSFDNKQSIRFVGQGEIEGLECRQLTKGEVSFVKAIDLSIVPIEIKVSSLKELESLTLYKPDGSSNIFVGFSKGQSIRIYKTPGFNPMARGLLKPMSDEQFVTYYAEKKSELDQVLTSKLMADQVKAKKDLEDKSLDKKIKTQRESLENTAADVANLSTKKVYSVSVPVIVTYVEPATKKVAAPPVQKPATPLAKIVQASPAVVLQQNVTPQQNTLIARTNCIQPPHGFAPLPEGGRIAANECR